MDFEEETVTPTDHEIFHRRLQIQAEQQAQELAWLLAQRTYERESIRAHWSGIFWRRIQQWAVSYLPTRLKLQRQPVCWPAPPTEEEIEIIEVEYHVRDAATQPSDAKASGKGGLP
jgi:hypothetical protein